MAHSEYEGKRVWILGAGFSRHLGAPLFHELFSGEMGLIVKTAFSEADGFDRLHDLFARVGIVYRSGAGKVQLEEEPSPIAWSNPEQFLEVISGWATNPGLVYEGYHQGESTDYWETILVAALRRLAAEVSCCYADPSVFMGERALAYKQWASGLKAGQDVIITFNYDTIVESLGIVGLQQVFNDPSDTEVRMFNGRVPLLKMHGSVDWKRTESGNVKCSLEDTMKECRKITEFAMAIPGTGKLSFNRENQWLWNCAEQFVQGAETINFVGYRIPETDGLALNSICKSIRRRCAASKRDSYPRINIVLGPMPTPERGRAEGLMRLLLGEPASANPRSRKVHVHDMWAQDYFQKSGTLS
ncbi:hypothetical protein RISK_002350 [Rhodopirellula islandica]|uniref:SIR2-like domain-containing protein n=1 Tax=Rhodopirellula islandica TaxID=595434 RepID=A0A0J1BGQ4_RHOIS|nr:SIR2 family protein [Rhodopirellula islandica]KLU05718.1 hypothetical protein RISK_002350 [Rhodopirellula islandica]